MPAVPGIVRFGQVVRSVATRLDRVLAPDSGAAHHDALRRSLARAARVVGADRLDVWLASAPDGRTARRASDASAARAAAAVAVHGALLEVSELPAHPTRVKSAAVEDLQRASHQDPLRAWATPAARGVLFAGVTHRRTLVGGLVFATDGPHAWTDEQVGASVILAQALGCTVAARTAAEERDVNRDRVRSLFERAHAPMFVVDPASGRIVDANEAASRAYGWSRHQLQRMLTADLAVRPAVAVLEDLSAAARGELSRLVASHRRADGTVREVELYVGPVVDRGRTLLVTIVHDVTEQCEREKRALALERAYESLVEHSPDLVVRFDRELRHLYVNQAVERLTGRDRSEYLGRTNEELGMPADLVRFWNRELGAAFDGTEPRAIRFGYVDGAGRQRHLESLVVPEAGPEGPPETLLSVVRDVTDWVEARETVHLQARALEAAVTGIVITDREGTIKWCNPAFTALTGYPASEVVGRNPRDLVRSGEHDAAFYRDMWETILAGRVWRGEIVNRRRDGRHYLEEMTVAPVVDDHGEVTHFVAVKQDVSGKKAQEALITRLAAALDQSPDLVVLADVAGRITFVNRRFTEVTGHPLAAVAGRHLAELSVPAQDEVVRAHVARAAEGVGWSGDLQGSSASGDDVWEHVRLVPLRDASGAVTQLLRASEDVTESRSLRERLAYLGAYDPLTGLANRDLLLRRLESSLGEGTRNGDGELVVIIEVASVTAVNEAWGYGTGDALLVHLARRLQSAVQPTDLVARMAGDRFAVVCAPVHRRRDAVAIATTLEAALEAPFEIEGHEVVVDAALGAALAPDDAMDAATLLRCAEAALSKAWSDPRGRLRFFTDELSDLARDELRTEAELRRGLTAGEFTALYQPRLDMAQRRVVGFEALARWRHPMRGLLGPASFMELAERTGYVVDLDTEIARQAIARTRAWLNAGLDPGRVSVNLSALGLADGSLAERLLGMLHAAAVPPAHLEVEVTESAAMTAADTAIATLRQLRDHGVGVALDDFGTGHSSLGYLQRLPATTLKIDRTFVWGLDTPASAAIVRAITDIGRALGLEIVAEGVETEAQRAALQALGCRFGQGYLFGVPLPPTEATRRLRGSAR
mgnify:FL=1